MLLKATFWHWLWVFKRAFIWEKNAQHLPRIRFRACDGWRCMDPLVTLQFVSRREGFATNPTCKWFLSSVEHVMIHHIKMSHKQRVCCQSGFSDDAINPPYTITGEVFPACDTYTRFLSSRDPLVMMLRHECVTNKNHFWENPRTRISISPDLQTDRWTSGWILWWSDRSPLLVNTLQHLPHGKISSW